MSETPQTITLSDGSVWEYAPKGKAPRGMLPRCHWAVLFRDGRKTGYGSPHLLDPMAQLTASDYRKIADVLDPPRESEDTARMTRAQAIAVWNKCNPDLSFDALLPSQRGRLLKYADEIEVAARGASK